MGLRSSGLTNLPPRRPAIIALLVLTVALVPFVVAPTPASAVDLPQVNCHIGPGGTTVCSVNRPTVNQPLTRYDQVRFAPGDQVSISAGGCVQTGGVGATWKRYADPVDGDGLYYGTIYIPFATLQPVSLLLFNGRTLTIPFTVSDPSQLYLRLGYVDDAYSDNGYWGTMMAPRISARGSVTRSSDLPLLTGRHLLHPTLST
jgi:hypothetical protein